MPEKYLENELSLKSDAEAARELDIAKAVVRKSIEEKNLELSLEGKPGVLDDHLDPLADKETSVEPGAMAAVFDWLKEAVQDEAPWLFLEAQKDGSILLAPQRASEYAKIGATPFLIQFDFGLPEGRQQLARAPVDDELETVELAMPALEIWNILPAVARLNGESMQANLDVVIEEMREYAELRALGLKYEVGDRRATSYTKRVKRLDSFQQKRLGQLSAEVIALCKERWNNKRREAA